MNPEVVHGHTMSHEQFSKYVPVKFQAIEGPSLKEPSYSPIANRPTRQSNRQRQDQGRRFARSCLPRQAARPRARFRASDAKRRGESCGRSEVGQVGHNRRCWWLDARAAQTRHAWVVPCVVAGIAHGSSPGPFSGRRELVRNPPFSQSTTSDCGGTTQRGQRSGAGNRRGMLFD